MPQSGRFRRPRALQPAYRNGEVATGGFTSVYTLERLNPYLLRCDGCGKMNRGAEGGNDCNHCAATLPARQPYW